MKFASGCNLIGHDEELDGAQVVAKVNGTEVTKAEWEAYRDYLASYYQQYYQQYFGVSMQLTEDDVKAYGDAALEQMIESIVLQDKMKEFGSSRFRKRMPLTWRAMRTACSLSTSR